MPVDQGVAAAVKVVELRLGDRIVDVDRGEQQPAGLGQLVKPVHAGGRLLGDARITAAARSTGSGGLEQRGKRRQDDPVLLGVPRSGSGTVPAASHRRQVDQQVASPPSSRIMACRPATSGPARCTTGTPQASRPSRRTRGSRGRDRGRRMVLGGEDVAAHQRTSAPSSISVSISTAVWTVMWSEPIIARPQRLLAPNSSRGASGLASRPRPDRSRGQVGEADIGDLGVGGRDGHIFGLAPDRLGCRRSLFRVAE